VIITLLLTGFLLLAMLNTVQAQSIISALDGSGMIVTPNGNTIDITGGIF
jgi:hypothetical protein